MLKRDCVLADIEHIRQDTNLPQQPNLRGVRDHRN